MKILISGASGLIGRELQRALRSQNHAVISLVRKYSDLKNAIFWDPSHGNLDVSLLEGMDAVVHLAGENIAAGRWTQKQKREILESRLKSTKTLVEAFSLLKQPPKLFISGSAVGYYGNCGLKTCFEESGVGQGFLADVCFQWEKEAKGAEQLGIRTILLRTGIVLSTEGGALAKMLPAFRLGLGGKLGSGLQYMSWIALEDVLSIILFALANEKLTGAINVVAPYPVTNVEFTKTLGKVLKRPTFMSVPSWILKGVLGKEVAEEMLLSSTRAEPKRLLAAGYVFKYPTLELALKNCLHT